MTMRLDKTKILLWGLSALSAVLMSLPFLLPHCGVFALLGLVPLLCMERIATFSGVRKVWIWHYSCFVAWNALTTFWVCNATLAGGIFAILANAFQMSLVFGLFRYSRKLFGGVLPYLFLALSWIAWERFYFSAQISWPWLTLGNAFARTTSLIQWYEYLGTLGGSLWIWAANLSVFGLMCSLSDGSFFSFNAKAKCASVIAAVAVIFLPMGLSLRIYSRVTEGDETVQTLILQPNIDPYHKFRALSQDQQNAILLDLAQRNLPEDDSPVLIVAPETFAGGVVLNDLLNDRTVSRFRAFLSRHPAANMLFGASTYEYRFSDRRPSPNARELSDGSWIISHNSAIMADASDRVELFHKSKLVVGVEMMPFPSVLRKLDELLGGAMGRCEGQDEISLLNYRLPSGENVPVGCAICYESVYGEYCTDYVRKGAKLLAVITNDAWWGNTPGYRQHLSYSSLRAIETRRNIVRCANTGISAIIDSRGEIVRCSPWWEKCIIAGTAHLGSGETFFVRNGDIAGRLCTFLFVLLCLSLGVRLIIKRK